MEGWFGTLGLAILVFASTNMDDIFLLAAFFADPHLRAQSVVLVLRGGGDADGDDGDLRQAEARAEGRTHSQALASPR